MSHCKNLVTGKEIKGRKALNSISKYLSKVSEQSRSSFFASESPNPAQQEAHAHALQANADKRLGLRSKSSLRTGSFGEQTRALLLLLLLRIASFFRHWMWQTLASCRDAGVIQKALARCCLQWVKLQQELAPP